MRKSLQICILCSALFSTSAIAKCIGYSGPGGQCSTGPGGGLYTGPGGGLYTLGLEVVHQQALVEDVTQGLVVAVQTNGIALAHIVNSRKFSAP